MADINPIQGPLPPKEDPNKRDLKKIGTPEKFKETYRVQAIKESDAESKKKRKRQGEQQEDDANLAQPQAQIQLSASQKTDDSPLAIRPTQRKLMGSQEPLSAAEPKTLGSSYTPTQPATQEQMDQEDFLTPTLPDVPEPLPSSLQPLAKAATPPPPAAPPTPQAQAQEAPSASSYYTEQMQAPQSPQTTPSSDTNFPSAAPQTEPQGKTTTTAHDEKKTTTKESDDKKKSPLETKEAPLKLTPEAETHLKKAEKLPLEEKGEAAPIKKEEVATKEKPQTPTAATPLQEKAPTPQVAAVPAGIQPLRQVQSSQQSNVAKAKDISAEEEGLSWKDETGSSTTKAHESKGDDKGGDKDKEGQGSQDQTQAVQGQPIAPFIAEAPSVQAPTPAYTSFSPQLLEMFDKMVGTMTVMQETTGERKTTITLTSPKFASSAFFGAEVIIEEDLNLAPGQYNIKLVGSPEAVQLFQAKSNDLLAAFQAGNYNFRVQRIDTAIQSTDKPLFKRKESASSDTGADANTGDSK